MIHIHRCGNGCKNLITGPNYPAGACFDNGLILKLDPKVREWISLKGCCTYNSGKPDPIIEQLDALGAEIILRRQDFQVPDKNGRCPEVPGFEFVLDSLGHIVGKEFAKGGNKP